MKLNSKVCKTFMVIILGLLSLHGIANAEGNIIPNEAFSIARDAYIYGFPLVDNYRVMYSYFVDTSSPVYKSGWNILSHADRLATPQSLAVPAPNVDTLYSFLGADLRSEPLVLSLPEAEKDRYYSLQFIDLYTFNFAYAGTRATSGASGTYLLVGPDWRGDKPAGIDTVIRCETYFALVLYRTQVLNPDDLEQVKKFQAKYQVMPLSHFLRQDAPPSPSDINFVKPVNRMRLPNTEEFFNCLNFILGFCPVLPEEASLRERFLRIGIQAGEKFSSENFSQAVLTAINSGVIDAQRNAQQAAGIMRDDFPGQTFFGNRSQLGTDYLRRMIGAMTGLYGNSQEEALYYGYNIDSIGSELSGEYRYTLHFAYNEFPPIDAFWSLTLYSLPGRFLVANPLHRYVINSSMLKNLKTDTDGGITLYIQHDSPGIDRENNWLPTPAGAFMCSLRLYLPKSVIINSGIWYPPLMYRVE
jgi:hypothetical protein